jgi:hypothetical protein
MCKSEVQISVAGAMILSVCLRGISVDVATGEELKAGATRAGAR